MKQLQLPPKTTAHGAYNVDGIVYATCCICRRTKPAQVQGAGYFCDDCHESYTREKHRLSKLYRAGKPAPKVVKPSIPYTSATRALCEVMHQKSTRHHNIYCIAMRNRPRAFTPGNDSPVERMTNLLRLANVRFMDLTGVDGQRLYIYLSKEIDTREAPF